MIFSAFLSPALVTAPHEKVSVRQVRQIGQFLAADPLEDITNTRRIASVYMRGEEVDRSSYGTM